MYSIEQIQQFKEFMGYKYSRNKNGRISLTCSMPTSVDKAEIVVIDSLFTHQKEEEIKELTDEVLNIYKTMNSLSGQEPLVVEVAVHNEGIWRKGKRLNKVAINVQGEVVGNEVTRVGEMYNILVDLVNVIEFIGDEEKFEALMEYSYQFNTYLYVHKAINEVIDRYEINDRITENMYARVVSKALVKNLSEVFKIVAKPEKLQLDLRKFYDRIDEGKIDFNMKKRIEVASVYYTLDEYGDYLLDKYKPQQDFIVKTY